MKRPESSFQNGNRALKGSVKWMVELHSVYYSLLLKGIFMLGDAEWNSILKLSLIEDVLL